MKFTQLFWTPKEKTINSVSSGWLDLKYHIFSWILSCNSILKFYPNLSLITDDFGEEILINKLKLPYTNIRKDFESINIKYSDNIWALKKLYSYSLHNESFTNIDSDVYIWNSFPRNVLDSKLYAQNYEINMPQYISCIKDIKKYKVNFHLYDLPDLNLNKNIIALNAGIIGCNLPTLFKKYYKIILKFVDGNIDKINKLRFEQFNLIIEQYLLFEFLKLNKIDTKTVLETTTSPEFIPNLTNFSAVPFNCNYIHLMGGKKIPSVCEQLERRVRLEYPDQYFSALQYLNKETGRKHSFFNTLSEEKIGYNNKVRFKYLFNNEINIIFYRTIKLFTCSDIYYKYKLNLTVYNFVKKYLTIIEYNKKKLNINKYYCLKEIVDFEKKRYKYLKSLNLYKYELLIRKQSTLWN